VGYQYILLIDADTDAVIQQWEGNAVDGNYSFAFNDVPFSSGQSVHIIAGTDQNNDGFICDAGESCGAYISLDQPIAITATGNHNGLDFISGYSIGLRSLSVSDIPKNGIAIRRQRSKQVLMK
jgi:serine protease